MNPFALWAAWLRKVIMTALRIHPDGGVQVEPGGGVGVTTGTARLLVYEHFDNANPYSAWIETVPYDDLAATPVQVTAPGEYRWWWARPSPDGSRILAQRDPKGHTGSVTEEVFIINVDGSNPTRIMSIVDGDKQNDPNAYGEMGHFEWTSNSTLVFSASTPGQGGTTYGIWSCDDDGTNHARLTDGSVLSIDPSVCPNGDILFIRGNVNPVNNEIWIMDSDGSNQIQVSDDTTEGRTERADFDPYCSPDGSRIIDLRLVQLIPSRWDNMIQDIDGANATVVADGTVDATAYSVARWVDNSTVVTYRLGAGSRVEIISYNVDAPATKTVLLAGASAADQFRGATVFTGPT